MPQGGMGVLFRERTGILTASTRAVPRPGCHERSGLRSTEHLSVPDVFIGTTRHARDALGQTPISAAPVSIDGHGVVTHGQRGRVDL
jgi:hypothetical protein